MAKTHVMNPVPQLSILDRLQIAQTFIFRVPWTIVSTLSRRWWPFGKRKPPPLREHLLRHIRTWYDPGLPEFKSKFTTSR